MPRFCNSLTHLALPPDFAKCGGGQRVLKRRRDGGVPSQRGPLGERMFRGFRTIRGCAQISHAVN